MLQYIQNKKFSQKTSFIFDMPNQYTFSFQYFLQIIQTDDNFTSYLDGTVKENWNWNSWITSTLYYLRINGQRDLKIAKTSYFPFFLTVCSNLPSRPYLSLGPPAPFQCWFKLPVFFWVAVNIEGGGRHGLLSVGSGQGMVLYSVRNRWPKHFGRDCRPANSNFVSLSAKWPL